MKKIAILTIFFGIIILAASAQLVPKTFVFDGYLLTPDSSALEGAFVINYRDSKTVASDHSGYFKIVVQEGDSVMVNHVSMAPKVVKVYPTYIRKARIYVEYRIYNINPITTYDERKQLDNVNQSVEQIKKDIKEQILVDPNKRTGNDNTYNESTANPGATIIRVSPTVSKKDKMDKREIKGQ